MTPFRTGLLIGVLSAVVVGLVVALVLTNDSSSSTSSTGSPTSQGWGHVVGVQGSTAGDFICADNQPAEPSSPILAYGRAVLVGRIACLSSPKGVRCANRDTRHGFQIAREQVQLF